MPIVTANHDGVKFVTMRRHPWRVFSRSARSLASSGGVKFALVVGHGASPEVAKVSAVEPEGSIVRAIVLHSRAVTNRLRKVERREGEEAMKLYFVLTLLEFVTKRR